MAGSEQQNGVNAVSVKSNGYKGELRARDIVIALRDVSKVNDPAALASVIERNEATLKQGWIELDRLTREFEALNAREKSIIQKDLQTPQPTLKLPPQLSASA
jgi:hypothetical protein